VAGVGGERRSRGAIPAALLAVAGLFLVPGPSMAADGEAVVLARGTLVAVVADLDGDGQREVVAVRPEPQDRIRYRVEAWGLRDGAWRSLGSTTLVRWDAGDDSGSRPVRAGAEGVGMLVLSRQGGPRVMVASAADDGDDFPGGCCLSLGTLRLAGGRLHIDLVEQDLGPAESLMVVDLDADATDELLVTRGTTFEEFGPPRSDYAVLRQAGDGFEAEPLRLPDATGGHLAAFGESDGAPGDDLVFITSEGTGLLRVSADGAGLRSERADDTGLFGWQMGGWFAGAVDGRLIAIDQDGISLFRWPRGGTPERVGGVEARDYPSVFVIGDGPDARLVEVSGMSGTVGEALGLRIYDLDLELERLLPAPQILQELWELNMTRSGPVFGAEWSVFPMVGPVPGGLSPERPAFLGLGSLVVIEPDGSLRVDGAAPLTGGGAMGTVGPDDAWLAYGGDWFGSGTSAYLGASGFERPDTVLTVMPIAAFLDRGAAEPEITVSGATEVGVGADRRLVAADGGFEVTIDGPPGTLVLAVAGRRVESGEITDGPITLPIDPGGRRGTNEDFEATVMVVHPGGILGGMRWDARILREAPEVTVRATTELFSMRTTLSGKASSGATVIVDGQPVETNRNGAYRLEVDAPIWPREVQVIARDPVGNEAVQRIEVIGFVDYRGLPWIPIMAALTVVAGVALFLHTPRVRPARGLVPDGDGLLEEIDGDPI